MKTRTKIAAFTAIIGTLAPLAGSAAVVGVNIGTGMPPALLGGYTMSVFDPGSISGQSYYEHMVNGVGEGAVHPGENEWQTWGQNYTGNVYVSPTGDTALSLTLSPGTEAVYFYEEPDQFSNFTMTAVDSSGATVSTTINGSYGSAGIGFYENVASGQYLSRISVTCSDPDGFAIGEFGINGGTLGGAIPEGSTFGLLAFGLGGLLVRARWRDIVRQFKGDSAVS